MNSPKTFYAILDVSETANTGDIMLAYMKKKYELKMAKETLMSVKKRKLYNKTLDRQTQHHSTKMHSPLQKVAHGGGNTLISPRTATYSTSDRIAINQSELPVQPSNVQPRNNVEASTAEPSNIQPNNAEPINVEASNAEPNNAHLTFAHPSITNTMNAPQSTVAPLNTTMYEKPVDCIHRNESNFLTHQAPVPGSDVSTKYVNQTNETQKSTETYSMLNKYSDMIHERYFTLNNPRENTPHKIFLKSNNNTDNAIGGKRTISQDDSEINVMSDDAGSGADPPNAHFSGLANYNAAVASQSTVQPKTVSAWSRESAPHGIHSKYSMRSLNDTNDLCQHNYDPNNISPIDIHNDTTSASPSNPVASNTNTLEHQFGYDTNLSSYFDMDDIVIKKKTQTNVGQKLPVDQNTPTPLTAEHIVKLDPMLNSVLSVNADSDLTDNSTISDILDSSDDDDENDNNDSAPKLNKVDRANKHNNMYDDDDEDDDDDDEDDDDNPEMSDISDANNIYVPSDNPDGNIIGEIPAKSKNLFTTLSGLNISSDSSSEFDTLIHTIVNDSKTNASQEKFKNMRIL